MDALKHGPLAPATPAQIPGGMAFLVPHSHLCHPPVPLSHHCDPLCGSEGGAELGYLSFCRDHDRNVMVLEQLGAVGSAPGCCRMLLSWEKAAALGGRSPPAWEPAGQGEAQSAQTCSLSSPMAESSPEAGALNGSFQSFLPHPSLPCPAAKPEPLLCSLLKNKSFWDEFHASEQCQPGCGRDVRVHYSMGMKGSSLPCCTVEGMSPLFVTSPVQSPPLHCWRDPRLHPMGWDPLSSFQPEPGIAYWEGLGYPGGTIEAARQGGGGKGPIPKTWIALIISQDWEGE